MEISIKYLYIIHIYKLLRADYYQAIEDFESLGLFLKIKDSFSR